MNRTRRASVAGAPLAVRDESGDPPSIGF